MKIRTTIMEKVDTIEKILLMSTDEENNMSCIGFEVGSVYYITNLYVGDKYNIGESIIDSYENMMQSDFWDNFIAENEDAKKLLKMAEKRYEELFFINNNLENKIIGAIESLISVIPSKDDVNNFVSENKEFMDSLDDRKIELIKTIAGDDDDKVG